MPELRDDDLPLQSFYRQEREGPDRLFLTQPCDKGKLKEWTWAQAGQEARRMAAWLAAQHPEPGTRVAILSRNCAWWVMADLAIMMAGHVSVPVYPSLRPQSVRQILEHSGAALCFVGAVDDAAEVCAAIPDHVRCVRFPAAEPNGYPAWDEIARATAPVAGGPVRSPGELATIIYTSGTTGSPKGVMHSFATFTWCVLGVEKILDGLRGGRVLSYLPLAHIVERCGVEMSGFYLGFHLFFTEGLETFVTDLKRASPTLFLSVPRLLLKFQQGVFAKVPKQKLDILLRIPLLNAYMRKRILRQLGLDTVRHAASGAAPLPTEILLWYRGLGLHLAEGYGMTETFITHLPHPTQVRPGYVGTPMFCVEQKLSEQGELLIRSPMNTLGYYHDLENTKAVYTPDGFFKTGDLARIDPDGQLKLIGRVKEQFKTSKGKYVAPAPIESRLMAHPAVEGCCLTGAGMPNPFAILLLTAEAREKCSDAATRKALEDSLQALLNQVNGELEAHEQVDFLAIVDGPWTVGNGLITPTLKIRRTALENRYQALVDIWNQQHQPIVWESAPRN